MALTFKPPATQRRYDVCVVGSQLGGAVAGALLARRGFRVLHVDHDGVRAWYEDGGYLLPYAPAVLLSPRLQPAAEIALGELGLATDAARALEPSTPGMQILLPRHRVDVPNDPARRLAELKREWPSDADRLEAALAELGRRFDAAAPFLRSLPPLPPVGFGDRRAIGKALKFAGSAPAAPDVSATERAPFEGVEDHPFLASLHIGERFLSYLDGDPAPLATARLLGGMLRGTYHLTSGLQWLRDTIRRRIAESRGEILGAEGPAAIATQLDVAGGKVGAIRLAGSKNAWVARVFIAATDAPALARLLPPEESTGKMAALLQQVRPSRELLAINVVVKAAALPPALGDTALVLRDAAGGDGIDNAVLLQVLAARRDKGKGASEAVADERVVCAAAFVPATARDEGDAHLEALGRRIRDAISEAIPFFERHLVRESMPALAAPRELRGSRLLPHPLYQLDLERTLGITGLPCRSPFKNLVFAGREVVPGLGVEGEFHAGIQAAAAAQEVLGKKELFR